MSASVDRAVRLIRDAASDPVEASALLLAAASIADWIDRTDQPIPTSERNVRTLLLGAAAVLEAEYTNAVKSESDRCPKPLLG